MFAYGKVGGVAQNRAAPCLRTERRAPRPGVSLRAAAEEREVEEVRRQASEEELAA